jgi:D-threo-aldose 1-dehydrogenase
LAHPQVASVIPGLDSPRHIERTLKLLRTAIPDALWRDLKNQGLLRADAPVPVTEATGRASLKDTHNAGHFA